MLPNAKTSTVEASLADVYDIDRMGSRTEDLQLWESLTKTSQTVVEIGCGNGRIPKALAASGFEFASWVGVDISDDMLELATEDAPGWFQAILGDATDRRVSAEAVHASGKAFDIAIIPFSTLFLIPHNQQISVLKNLSSIVKPGGKVCIEVFAPQFKMMKSGAYNHVSVCNSPVPGEQWVRVSEFRVDGASRTTKVDRFYGTPNNYRYHVSETIYWRLTNEFIEMVDSAGLIGLEVYEGGNVPRNHILLIAEA